MPAFVSAAVASLLGLCNIFTLSARAQTAQFLGAQISMGTSLAGPTGVASDSAGNIYIADRGNNRVVMETPNTTGGYTQTVIDSNLQSPNAVAVDSAGNVYISDLRNYRVIKDTKNVNGVYLENLVKGALSEPSGVAVDSSGNVYISDNFTTGILRRRPPTGTTLSIRSATLPVHNPSPLIPTATSS